MTTMFEKIIIEYANSMRHEHNFDFTDIENRKTFCVFIKDYFLEVLDYELDIFMAKMLNDYWADFLQDPMEDTPIL